MMHKYKGNAYVSRGKIHKELKRMIAEYETAVPLFEEVQNQRERTRIKVILNTKQIPEIASEFYYPGHPDAHHYYHTVPIHDEIPKDMPVITENIVDKIQTANNYTNFMRGHEYRHQQPPKHDSKRRANPELKPGIPWSVKGPKVYHTDDNHIPAQDDTLEKKYSSKRHVKDFEHPGPGLTIASSSLWIPNI